jgi:hypothetical protein
MIYVLLVLIVGIVIYFEWKFKKIQTPIDEKINIDYPNTIIKEFKFEDLEDAPSYILDLINLVISENWTYTYVYRYSDGYLFTKGDMGLLINYSREDNKGKFKSRFSRIELGKYYDHHYGWFSESIFYYKRNDNKSFKNVNESIDNLIHHSIHNEMVKKYQNDKEYAIEQRNKLDEILISVRRDRRIDDILNK